MNPSCARHLPHLRTPPWSLRGAITWAVVAAAAIVAWMLMLPYVPEDAVIFNMPWYEHAVRTGPFAVFAAPWSNYTPPYLYVLAALAPLHGLLGAFAAVKLAAIVGTVLLVAACRQLLRSLDVPRAGVIACGVAALPSVALNAGALAQADAWVTAPLIMALATAVDRRHRSMLAWCGVALSIKLQAMLVAPFVLGLLIARRVPFRWWPVAPAVAVAMLAPAWLLGWPLGDLLTIYARQGGTFDDLSRNAPNVWMVAQALGLRDPSLTGLALAGAAGAGAALAARMSADAARLAGTVLLRYALLAPLLTAGLLPRMHERYFFAADVIALMLFAVERTRRTAAIAVAVQAGSTLAIVGYLASDGLWAALGGLVMIGATVMVARDLWPAAANDNPLPLRPLPA